jgi:hypothetical protein
MSKARAVECQHPVMLGHQVEQAACRKFLDHAAIAMNEHNRWLARASPDVMQPQTVCFDEISNRRIFTFGSARVVMHGEGCSGQGYSDANGSSGPRHAVASA